MFRPTLIMKPVGLSCNLACSYCYNNSERVFGGKVQRMPVALVERVVKELVQLEEDIPLVRFIWHGGEPLLAGLDFYREVIKLQCELSENGIAINNSIQTNGTLLTKEWVKFFKEHHFRVGVSLDGPQPIHDGQRTNLAGEGSFDQVLRGARLLQDGGVPFGVISVITQSSLPHAEEIYRFLRDAGFSHCDFSPCAEVNAQTGELFPFSISAREYAVFMRTIFDAWFADDDPSFRIRTFSEFIQGNIGGRQRLCNFKQACHNYLAIDLGGDVYVCGRFAGIEKMLIGNIRREPLAELLSSEAYSGIRAEVQEVKPECQSCRWQPICRGGCSYYRHLQSESLSGPNYLCQAYKEMFAHIERTISPLLPVEEPAVST